MAKTFNIAALFNATHAAASADDATQATVFDAGITAIKSASLADCVDAFLSGEVGVAASKGAKQAAIHRAAELLASKRVDTSDVDAAREALLPLFWAKAGGKGAPTKGDTDESVTFYNRHYAKARRMAQAIVKLNADSAATIRVPKALQAQIDALQEQLRALTTEYGADAVKEAKARNAAAVKAAKAKAAK